MAPIPHITQQFKGTTAELETLASANNLVAEHFYFSTTNNRYYYAATSSILIGPIDEGSMPTFTDTNTIEHTDNGNGDFEFAVIVDPAADNVLEATNEGLYVPDISIESGSEQYLTYNAATRELSVKQLLFSSVTEDETHATIAAFVAAEYTQGDEFQEGDAVILTEADPLEMWIHNGGTSGTVSDFTKINANHLDDSYIRALFSAGDGIDYNVNTGEISVDVANVNNALSIHSQGGLYVNPVFFTVANNEPGASIFMQGDLLRIQPAQLMNVSKPSPVGNTRSFDFSWDTSGASAGQVPTFDGTDVIWGAPAGGAELEHWEEDYHDTGVNDTIPIASWSVQGDDNNIDAVISPKGTGSFALQVADGTTANGAKRGEEAVDLQMGRGSHSNRVASGNRSIILGGHDNQASGNNSIAAGFGSRALGNESLAIGRMANANNNREFVFSGHNFAQVGSGEQTMTMHFPNGIFMKGSITDLDSTLRVRNIAADDSLTRVLVADANGLVHRREVSTIGGGVNIYSQDGTLAGPRNVGLSGNNLTFRDSSDNDVVRFSESGSSIRAMAGDIEIDNAANGLVLKSPNGTRHRVTVANASFLQVEAL